MPMGIPEKQLFLMKRKFVRINRQSAEVGSAELAHENHA